MFTVIMGVSLILLSPVDSDKRKLDKQQKRKYRKVVCVLVLFFLAFTVQFTTPSGLHSVLERPFSEANGRPFLVKRSPLIVC